MFNVSKESFNQEALMKQAQSVWTMLDEMADDNPESYKKFIEKQIAEGKKQFSPPEPHMCVRTLLKKPQPKPFYINVCGWMRVPTPPSEDAPVPVMGGKLLTVKDQNENFDIISVAFNPNIVEKFGRNSKNPIDRDTLVQLSMDFIESQQKVTILRKYEILGTDVLYKGDLKDIQASFTNNNNKFPQNPNQNGNSKSNGSNVDSDDSLLNKLRNLATDNGKDEQEDSDLSGITLSTDNRTSKSVLIEEVTDSVEHLKTPHYDLKVLRNNLAEDDAFEMEISLPGIQSISQCELDISEDDICLTVPSLYHLYLNLSKKIDEDSSSAKFSKKTATLTINMPIMR